MTAGRAEALREEQIRGRGKEEAARGEGGGDRVVAFTMLPESGMVRDAAAQPEGVVPSEKTSFKF